MTSSIQVCILIPALVALASTGAAPPQPSHCLGSTRPGSQCDFSGYSSECTNNQICSPDTNIPGRGVCCDIPKAMCHLSGKQGHRCRIDGDGEQCQSGYACTILTIPSRYYGVCCGIPEVCPIGTINVGACFVSNAGACAPDGTCRIIPGTFKGRGVCCAPPPPPPPPPPAQDCLHPKLRGGPCSLDGYGRRCKKGSVCTPRASNPQSGICCKSVPDVCPIKTLTGPLCPVKGSGKGKERLQKCKQGYKCTSIKYKNLGVCCSDNDQGRCPPSNKLPSPCPGVTECTQNQDCKPFNKCCPEGCNKVCRRAIYDPLPPTLY